jgi:hypothetical protein
LSVEPTIVSPFGSVTSICRPCIALADTGESSRPSSPPSRRKYSASIWEISVKRVSPLVGVVERFKYGFDG